MTRVFANKTATLGWFFDVWMLSSEGWASVVGQEHAKVAYSI